MRTTEIEYPD